MAAGRERRASPLRSLLPQPLREGALLAWWLQQLHPKAGEGRGSDPEPTCPPCGPEEPQPSPVPGHQPPCSVGTGLHSEGTPRPEQRGGGSTQRTRESSGSVGV